VSRVHISPYDPAWPAAFATARAEIAAVFAPPGVVVEHIGSTAVPGLAAKPVIDLLLGAPSLAVIEAAIPALAALGYGYRPAYEADIPERRYFVKAEPGALKLHLHGVVSGSALWRDHLAFRDALRGDAGLRADYENLKLDLARQFAADKAAYTAAKAPFIQEVLRTAHGGAGAGRVGSS
jgi:GrpB-like predicted nucleotidyltransferase (UPF0157 family)